MNEEAEIWRMVHDLFGEEIDPRTQRDVVRAVHSQLEQRVGAKSLLLGQLGPVRKRAVDEVVFDTLGELRAELISGREYIQLRSSQDPEPALGQRPESFR